MDDTLNDVLYAIIGTVSSLAALYAALRLLLWFYSILFAKAEAAVDRVVKQVKADAEEVISHGRRELDNSHVGQLAKDIGQFFKSLLE